MNKNEYNKKLIYKIYKEFFGKEPNLSKENIKNITIEIQSMLYILEQCGIIFLANEFVENGYGDLELPISMDIQHIITEQLMGNAENLNDGTVRFVQTTKKMITIAGSVIMSAIKGAQNKIEELRKISCALYIKKNTNINTEEKEGEQLPNCELGYINIEEQIADTITNELCKTNFDDTNIENIGKMIEESSIDTCYSMHISESGNGKPPVITKTNRKKVARALLR